MHTHTFGMQFNIRLAEIKLLSMSQAADEPDNDVANDIDNDDVGHWFGACNWIGNKFGLGFGFGKA